MAKIQNEIKELDLEVTGPAEFIYFGIEDRPDKKFDLLACMPIYARKAGPGHLEYYQSPAFSYVSSDYKGSMNTIGKAWREFVEHVKQDGLTVTDQCREKYNHWISFDSNENITELQIGIQ